MPPAPFWRAMSVMEVLGSVDGSTTDMIALGNSTRTSRANTPAATSSFLSGDGRCRHLMADFVKRSMKGGKQ